MLQHLKVDFSFLVPISWFGRAAAIKIMVFPRFFQVMQAVPISLPPAFFHGYQTRACVLFLGWINPLVLALLPAPTQLLGHTRLTRFFFFKSFGLGCFNLDLHGSSKYRVLLEQTFSAVLMGQLPCLPVSSSAGSKEPPHD